MARFLRPKSTGTSMYRMTFDALDGDMSAIVFADPVPEVFKLPDNDLMPPNRVLDPRHNYGGGALVSPANFPSRILISGRKSQLVDINAAYHMLFVNEKFLSVVSKFEINIQAFPVQAVWKNKTSAGTYYFFFANRLIDAVIRSKTTANWVPTLPGKGIWMPDHSTAQTFVFDKGLLGDAHMWVDPNMTHEGALVSEALWAALKAAGITCFYDFPECEEISP